MYFIASDIYRICLISITFRRSLHCQKRVALELSPKTTSTSVNIGCVSSVSAFSEQRTRNESQRLREKWSELKSGEGLSFHFSRGQNRKSRSSSFLGHFLLRNHRETLATHAG